MADKDGRERLGLCGTGLRSGIDGRRYKPPVWYQRELEDPVDCLQCRRG